jgi:hypothetical protein
MFMKDVHTEHCCIKHGCKYSDPNCTVTTGKAPQSFPCEDCEYEEERYNEFIERDDYKERRESLNNIIDEIAYDNNIYIDYVKKDIDDIIKFILTNS